VKKTAGGGSHPRKALSAPGQARLLAYALTDGQWHRLREHIPDQLATDLETKLRTNIGLCCKHFFDQCRDLRDGGVTAAALKPPGKDQLSTFDKLANGLRMAANAWAEMGGDTVPNRAAWLDRLRAEPRLVEVGHWEDHDFQWSFDEGMSPEEAVDFAIQFNACADEDARQRLCKLMLEDEDIVGARSFRRYQQRTAGKFFDDRLGPLSDLGAQLEGLARDAERRRKSFQDVEDPVTMTARPQLVQSVKKRLEDVGLKPGATNRVYASSDSKTKSGSGNPTWFQKFMAELNNGVLGIDGWGPLGPGDLPAFYSEITSAQR
jgi:hypothetical protein